MIDTCQFIAELPVRQQAKMLFDTEAVEFSAAYDVVFLLAAGNAEGYAKDFKNCILQTVISYPFKSRNKKIIVYQQIFS